MHSGIQIKTSFFPLAWFLYFVKPTIQINEKKYKRSWGESFFSLAPGDYNIRISFPYFGVKECGANEIKVTISENRRCKVKYYKSTWMFTSGTIKEVT